MNSIPMIVRTTPTQFSGYAGIKEYYPQVVTEDCDIYRGPCLGTNLTPEQIDGQFDLLKDALENHGFDPAGMGWVSLT